ncbi:hypothetical protein KCU83_g343, partial [Aureobasidium melanogenum]
LWVSLSASRLGCRVESGLVMVGGNCASKSYGAEMLTGSGGPILSFLRLKNFFLLHQVARERRTVATFAASAPRARTWRAVISWL